jgi:hypothetical protein
MAWQELVRQIECRLVVKGFRAPAGAVLHQSVDEIGGLDPGQLGAYRSHGAFVAAATVATVAQLLAYAINDRDRWRRFVFLIFLALAVAAGWWLLADGGIQVLLHDFGRT